MPANLYRSTASPQDANNKARKYGQDYEITQHINSISFYDSIVVFEKQKRKKPFHIKKGDETIVSYIPNDLTLGTILRKIKSKIFGRPTHSFDQNDRGKV